ncbi:hypothetical protein BH18ACT16_BH18ACT16_16510 [soil metagenome]
MPPLQSRKVRCRPYHRGLQSTFESEVDLDFVSDHLIAAMRETMDLTSGSLAEAVEWVGGAA